MKHVAIYIGRRVTVAGKLGYYWLIDGKTTGYMKQLAPAKIGEGWTITLNADGNVVLGGKDTPTQLPEKHGAPRERALEWTALDIAANQVQVNQRVNKKLAARKTEFDIALKPLQFMIDELRHNDERACFVQAVITALWRRK